MLFFPPNGYPIEERPRHTEKENICPVAQHFQSDVLLMLSLETTKTINITNQNTHSGITMLLTTSTNNTMRTLFFVSAFITTVHGYSNNGSGGNGSSRNRAINPLNEIGVDPIMIRPPAPLPPNLSYFNGNLPSLDPSSSLSASLRNTKNSYGDGDEQAKNDDAKSSTSNDPVKLDPHQVAIPPSFSSSGGDTRRWQSIRPTPATTTTTRLPQQQYQPQQPNSQSYNFQQQRPQSLHPHQFHNVIRPQNLQQTSPQQIQEASQQRQQQQQATSSPQLYPNFQQQEQPRRSLQQPPTRYPQQQGERGGISATFPPPNSSFTSRPHDPRQQQQPQQIKENDEDVQPQASIRKEEEPLLKSQQEGENKEEQVGSKSSMDSSQEQFKGLEKQDQEDKNEEQSDPKLSIDKLEEEQEDYLEEDNKPSEIKNAAQSSISQPDAQSQAKQDDPKQPLIRENHSGVGLYNYSPGGSASNFGPGMGSYPQNGGAYGIGGVMGSNPADRLEQQRIMQQQHRHEQHLQQQQRLQEIRQQQQERLEQHRLDQQHRVEEQQRMHQQRIEEQRRQHQQRMEQQRQQEQERLQQQRLQQQKLQEQQREHQQRLQQQRQQAYNQQANNLKQQQQQQQRLQGYYQQQQPSQFQRQQPQAQRQQYPGYQAPPQSRQQQVRPSPYDGQYSPASQIANGVNRNNLPSPYYFSSNRVKGPAAAAAAPPAASVTFMITNQMKRTLIEDLRYSRKDVTTMTADQAHHIIKNKISKLSNPDTTTKTRIPTHLCVGDGPKEECPIDIFGDDGHSEVNSSVSALSTTSIKDNGNPPATTSSAVLPSNSAPSTSITNAGSDATNTTEE